MSEFCGSCVDCAVKSCSRMDGKNPAFCLTTHMDEEALAEAMLLYTEDDWNRQTAISAAEVEAEFYCKMTRVEEIMEFARRMGFRRIGIATCAKCHRQYRLNQEGIVDNNTGKPLIQYRATSTGAHGRLQVY